MENNKSENLFSSWVQWHFSEMPNFLLLVWKNYILFALNYFSLPLLLKSLLAPWRKYKWNYPRGFDVAGYLSTWISNVFSRFLGALVRIVLIAIGVVFQLFVIFAGAIIFLLWVFVPFIVIAGLLFVLFY